ncbi:MAG: 2-oxoacid:acceptor oxidoreductase subunit alpha [Clostridiales bacterium]|jgi:2-oxoglutarate ferredoxin oxidoreductase subunit alpha|nr:2-oxoacid:acceptor oxidoreductase subunit alpha [Clostridiales bacterium]
MNILIGGAAGQGMDTIAYLLGKALVREGYGVLTAKDYMSRVRGGHNFTKLRVESKTPFAPAEEIDILIALNEETYEIHRESVVTAGRIIFDSDMFALPEVEKRGVPVPLQTLAKEAGGKIMSNTVAVGAALSLMNTSTLQADELLREMFDEKTAAQNSAALAAGLKNVERDSCFSMPPATNTGKHLFLAGNEALGLSALASGCNFLSAYPMTPATGIMAYMAGKQDQLDIVVEQAEDEISAINMVLGASYAGARVMTCTSGGGFSLMVEGLSLAGMTETPVVIIIGMRPGPATGLPTRTEQGDLDFALHAGHGEFPRAILCATVLEDAFYRLNKAFDLAEKYQIPVLFLSDQNFGDTARSIEPYDFTNLRYNRHLVNVENLERPYLRYRYSRDGISPRALPGQFPGETVLSDSDEHDENGNIIENAVTRKNMMDKRLQKMVPLADEMDEPIIYGHDSGNILLLGWGSTYGALREAVDILQDEGLKVTLLQFTDIWPLPVAAVNKLLPQAKVSFCVENNATGQFAGLLRRETGLSTDHKVLKYDGRPFLAKEIIREVKKHV